MRYISIKSSDFSYACLLFSKIKLKYTIENYINMLM